MLSKLQIQDVFKNKERGISPQYRNIVYAPVAAAPWGLFLAEEEN